MKKIILLVILGFTGWQWTQDTNTLSPAAATPVTSFDTPVSRAPSDSNFTCDGRQYCSEMTSRAEADFFVSNCPNTRMDGDKDGYGCENDSRF